jgi:hypothetical protein
VNDIFYPYVVEAGSFIARCFRGGVAALTTLVLVCAFGWFAEEVAKFEKLAAEEGKGRIGFSLALGFLAGFFCAGNLKQAAVSGCATIAALLILGALVRTTKVRTKTRVD